MNTLLAGIRDANYHDGGIRCLRLFQVDDTHFAELKADVDRFVRTETGSRVNDPAHITNWTKPRGEVVQFSLFNSSGRSNDFHSDHDFSCLGKRFYRSSEYPALAQTINAFPHKVNFRINLLAPGASLSPHEEHTVIRTRAGSVALRTRFHLPIITNPSAELMLDGGVYHLEAGTVYLVNHGCVHAACNCGDQNRIHLVWDMLLTREAFAFMFEEAAATPIFKRIAKTEQIVATLRTEEIGAYARIAPLVTREEANRIDWCEAQ